MESEALVTILKHVETGDWIWINSSVVLFEINQTPNLDRKNRLLKLCNAASGIIRLDEEIYAISENLKKAGFKSYDALHLACAKKASVDIMLSTDNKLIKKAIQHANIVNMRVENPWVWLQEVL